MDQALSDCDLRSIKTPHQKCNPSYNMWHKKAHKTHIKKIFRTKHGERQSTILSKMQRQDDRIL